MLLSLRELGHKKKIAEAGVRQKLVSNVIDAQVEGEKIESEEATKAAEIASRLATNITSDNTNEQ